MKQLLLVTLMVTVAHGASAQSRAPDIVPINDALPATARINSLRSALGTSRLYYVVDVDGKKAIRMYDRATQASAQIVRGALQEWTIADNGAAIGFTKPSEDGRVNQLWAIPIDPRTGLASAPERLVTTGGGDAPTFSPDGEWIAFSRFDDNGAGSSLVVVPSNGGPVRIVASLSGVGIFSIRWTPDNRTLFFSLSPKDWRTGLRTIHRVPVNGGAPTLVAETPDEGPMLSPDGSRLVFRDTTGLRSYVVADPSGKRLSTFTLPRGVRIHGWSGTSTLLATTAGTTQSVRAFDIANRRSRTLLQSEYRLEMPKWSEDGRQVSAIEWDYASTISVMNADGSGRREYPLREAGLWGSVWSPDGQWIAFRGRGGRGRSVSVLEVATGRMRALSYPKFFGTGYVAWSADSRRVRYTDAPALPGARDARGTLRLPLTEVGFDGSPRVIKEVSFNGTRVWLSTIQDSLVVVKRDAGEAVTIAKPQSGASETPLLPPNSGYVSRPVLSRDQQWIAFLRSASLETPVLTMLDVVRIDGTGRQTINLPFVAIDYDDYNPQFLPGNRELIVAEASDPSKDFALHVVNVSSGETRTLLTFARDNDPRERLWWSLSPDGRTVLYVATDHRPVTVGTIDVAKLLVK